ncbi:hypothetical protein [Mangrovibacterium sp.]|uniref:hypothetical protein n=1 Tax=Mangrovibacterium sp. TaxID=1961364 RepID=UPI00356521B2
MKHISLIVFLLTTFSAFSQGRNWTIETAKDGKTTVKYELVKEKQGTHFYYIAQTTTNASLTELDAYFSSSANHKRFLEATPQSEEVKKLSDDEWITYYYFNAPWPMADSDVVAKINRTKKDNKLVFTANAISNDYKKTDLDRVTSYKFMYEFEKVSDETTKITITADYIPVGSVPNFLIKAWFPQGPANIVTKLGSME